MKNTTKILIGIGISIVLTLILLLIFSILLTYTNISESTIAPAIIIITGVSLLIGTSITTSKIKKNGIINGMTIGGIYMLLLYITSSVLNMNYSINTYTISMILIGIICGGAGGVVGVNLKN